MTARLTRRTALLSALASAVAALGVSGFPARLYAEAPITPAQFLELSLALTGARRLDPVVAEELLAGLLVLGKGAPLSALVAQMPDPDTSDEVAEAVITAWYSGLFTGRAGLVAIDYTGALFWNALGFTKPAGFCGGQTNDWSEPAQSQLTEPPPPASGP